MDPPVDPLLRDIMYLSGLLLMVKVADIGIRAYEKRETYDPEGSPNGDHAKRKSVREWLKKLDL